MFYDSKVHSCGKKKLLTIAKHTPGIRKNLFQIFFSVVTKMFAAVAKIFTAIAKKILKRAVSV
jgi:hypothetical protein